MTIETEQSKLVSDEQLEIDIQNTIIEQTAYEKIAEGYALLEDLPENKDKRAMYDFHKQAWRAHARLCAAFIRGLRALQAERASLIKDKE